MTIIEVATVDGIWGAILEFDAGVELCWYPRKEGTLAWWVMEDGAILTVCVVGVG